MLYSEYIKSDKWKSIKKQKEKKGKRCAICSSSEFVELHHLFYSEWGTEDLSQLRLLCRNCHQLVHKLINAGELRFDNPRNHNSVFAITKHRIKKELGISGKNMFAI